jgi:phosphoglycerate dehydrogenase-like enzyme
VEADVVAALKDGRIGGYAADVYDKEPPEGSALISAPNTVLTPHLGASTGENLVRLGDCIVERMTTYTKGRSV